MNAVIFWIIRYFGYQVIKLILFSIISSKLGRYILVLIGLRLAASLNQVVYRSPKIYAER